MGLFEQIEVLTGHEFGAHLVIDGLASADRVEGQAAVDEHLVSPGQTQVSDENRRSDAEALRRSEPFGAAMKRGEASMCGRQPAPGVRPVHDVIVDERTRLEELQRGRSGECLGGVGTACAPPAPVAKCRTKAFAASKEI